MKVPVMITMIMMLFAVNATAIGASSIDTIKIYKHKSGVRYRVYKRHWFFGIGIFSTYGYPASRMNSQDSLVLMESKAPHYFRIYSRNNRLLFEGERPSFSHHLKGDIRFYYRSGKLKRIEHWSNEYTKDTCGYVILLNDAPGAEGIWKYFRRNGSLRKQLDYSIQLFSCHPLSYCYRKTITRYNRQGRIRGQKHKHWFCFKRDKENSKEL